MDRFVRFCQLFELTHLGGRCGGVDASFRKVRLAASLVWGFPWQNAGCVSERADLGPSLLRPGHGTLSGERQVVR